MSSKWAKEHQHPCIDCGQPCSHYAIKCRHFYDLARTPPQPRTLNCPDCGKAKSPKSIRCRSCDIKRRWKAGLMSSSQAKGDKAYAWKGGRVNRDGYIYIYLPNHLRANGRGYVAEHRIIWEEANGEVLPKGWVIHHLNGIKDDNRSKNLVALPNKKHSLVLQAKSKRIQELESLLNGQYQLL